MRGLGDVLAAILLLAVILTLVRPSSQAPTIVGALGQALSDLVHYAISG